jgi:2-amino-4-hydroxy-6-hydroxymethyldihydropteridine diphosphokinase
LPHPSMHQREFVLAPLAEIAPTIHHPTLHTSVSELLAALKQPQQKTG